MWLLFKVPRGYKKCLSLNKIIAIIVVFVIKDVNITNLCKVALKFMILKTCGGHMIIAWVSYKEAMSFVAMVIVILQLLLVKVTLFVLLI